MPTNQFGHVLNGTWHDVRINVLTGNDPERYQTCRRQSNK